MLFYKELGKIKKVRLEMDAAFRRLMNKIDALYLIAFEDEEKDREKELGLFIDQINTIISPMQRILNHRKTNKSSKYPS